MTPPHPTADLRRRMAHEAGSGSLVPAPRKPRTWPRSTGHRAARGTSSPVAHRRRRRPRPCRPVPSSGRRAERRQGARRLSGLSVPRIRIRRRRPMPPHPGRRPGRQDSQGHGRPQLYAAGGPRLDLAVARRRAGYLSRGPLFSGTGEGLALRHGHRRLADPLHPGHREPTRRRAPSLRSPHHHRRRQPHAGGRAPCRRATSRACNSSFLASGC